MSETAQLNGDTVVTLPLHGDANAQIVPIATAEQFVDLAKMAKADRHTVVIPSHLVIKKGEIVGYGSIGAVPMLNVWVHSRKVNKFESVRLLHEAEQMLAKGGAQFVILPCANDSPFRKYVGKLGYTELGNASYNLKRLKVES